MIAANKLIAAQVSDGSMAYILSTPTKQIEVSQDEVIIAAKLIAFYRRPC